MFRGIKRFGDTWFSCFIARGVTLACFRHVARFIFTLFYFFFFPFLLAPSIRRNRVGMYTFSERKVGPVLNLNKANTSTFGFYERQSNSLEVNNPQSGVGSVKAHRLFKRVIKIWRLFPFLLSTGRDGSRGLPGMRGWWWWWLFKQPPDWKFYTRTLNVHPEEVVRLWQTVSTTNSVCLRTMRAGE